MIDKVHQWYSFTPTDDITLHELAEIIKGVLRFRIGQGIHEKLSLSTRRHFKKVE